MIERLMTEVKCPKQAERGADEPPRPSMVWHLDPVTGKPTARWVFGKREGTADQQLVAA
jgi:hypothetical protein